MIAYSIIMGLVGLLLVFLGFLIWKKEKISLLHDYHYDKVSEENKKAFCKLSGIGVISVGAGILFGAFIYSPLCVIPFAIGLIIGLTLLIYAGRKYNS